MKTIMALIAVLGLAACGIDDGAQLPDEAPLHRSWNFGICGTADGEASAVEPLGAALCSKGAAPSVVALEGVPYRWWAPRVWTWSCRYEEIQMSCSAPYVEVR